MFSVKISFNGEIRRVAIPVVGGVPSIGINELNDLTKRAFPCPENSELLYSWTDEDGDVITVSSDEELRLAISCLHAQEVSAFKFQVLAKPLPRPSASDPDRDASMPSNAAHTTHAHVTCDECGMSPIIGPRFKCSVRSDFDLCQGCEAAGLQPYPMIKVYHPDQNPLAIIVAVDDDRTRFGGPHGHGHHRFGRHGHGHPHGPRGGPHGHRGGPNRPWCHKGDPSAENQNQPNQASAPWRGRCGAKSAFINAFDAFAAGLVGAGVIPGDTSAASEKTSSTPAAATANSTAAGNNDDAAATEQALLEQAVQASIEEQIAKQPVPAPSTNMTTVVAVEPKPAMRFVRDATFPDGTKVQPGSVFVKTWRVRNDGSTAWPDSTALVTAGGDLLTAPDLAVPVSQSLVNPGDEVDISATLTAPACTGRHTAYFRLQNRDTGAFFGQRLWADVRVEDADPSWFVLEAGDSAFGIAPEAAAEAAMSQPTTAAASAVADVVIADMKPQPQSQPEPHEQSAAMPEVQVLALPEQAVAPSAVAAGSSESTSASASDSADSVALDVWSRVWSSELEVLKQMGFTNIGALVPVLQEHIQVPAMLSDTKRVNADALQAIVIQLLGMSQ